MDLNSLPFGRSSHRVRRTVDDVVTAPDVEPSTNASLSGHVGSSKRSLENEFLQGSRARSEPCCVRRTDMVVGGRGRKVNLSYMETLASDTPPSLSSLPTPAQVCRPRRSCQGSGRKRTVSKRDDRPDIHDHLAHLHRKQKQCLLDNAVVHIPAQEVPSSPQRDLPIEDMTTLTFHGRTPLKTPSMLEKRERDGGMEGAVGEERKERVFRTTLFQHGSGHSGTGASSSLHSSGNGQRAKSNVHNFELERYFQVGHDFEFGNKLEQEQVSDRGQELKWRQAMEQTGSDVDGEVGEEGWQEELGFRPVGGLQRHWLARQAQTHFQGGVWKGKERGAREKRGQGGLRIHHPVEEHYEGVPFHIARNNLSSQSTGGFAEIWLHSLSPRHPEFSPSKKSRTPQQYDEGTLPHSSGTMVQNSHFDHVMELCSFNPQTFTIRNHFPREE